MRVVSLIASATEIVCALGCREWLVGRSHECDYPPSVRDLPVLTEPKFPISGASRDIDKHVKALVQEGTSVYRVFAGRLREAAPDVIVTQDQCDVCAVGLADVEEALCEWAGKPVQLISLKPERLEDVWRDIGAVAEALGVETAGAALLQALGERMAAIKEIAAASVVRPRVACIEWIEPADGGG